MNGVASIAKSKIKSTPVVIYTYLLSCSNPKRKIESSTRDTGVARRIRRPSSIIENGLKLIKPEMRLVRLTLKFPWGTRLG